MKNIKKFRFLLATIAIVYFLLLTSHRSAYSNGNTNVSYLMKQTQDAVVNIQGEVLSLEGSHQDLYHMFLGTKLKHPRKKHALGSGFIIDAQGHMITNYNFIKNAKNLKVQLKKDELHNARFIGGDARNNLALIKIEAKNKRFKYLDFANSSKTQAGQSIIALANPFGTQRSIRSGIVSAKENLASMGPYTRLIKIDIQVDPENQGGPILDMRGRVVCMATLPAIKNEKFSSLNFCLPSNLIRKLVPQLKEHGRIKRSWMGIVGKDLIENPERYYESSKNQRTSGVIIENIILSSPAEKTGLKIGEILVALQGKEVSSVYELEKILLGFPPNKRVNLKLYHRETGFRETSIVLGQWPKVEDLPVHSYVY